MRASRAIQWQKLILKLVIWGAAEVTLNLIGVDHLADYSEFLLNQKPEIVAVDFQSAVMRR